VVGQSGSGDAGVDQLHAIVKDTLRRLPDLSFLLVDHLVQAPS
jgi:hypothetical protein